MGGWLYGGVGCPMHTCIWHHRDLPAIFPRVSHLQLILSCLTCIYTCMHALVHAHVCGAPPHTHNGDPQISKNSINFEWKKIVAIWVRMTLSAKIELTHLSDLSTRDLNCHNNIQLFLQQFEKISVHCVTN